MKLKVKGGDSDGTSDYNTNEGITGVAQIWKSLYMKEKFITNQFLNAIGKTIMLSISF